MIKRTERGWMGHHILSDKCAFRRNTLLEYNTKRVVVSTVGCCYTKGEIIKIGLHHYYETMAFYAKKSGIYWDVDVRRAIEICSPWQIYEVNKRSDQKANDMHEQIVEEMTKRLEEEVL